MNPWERNVARRKGVGGRPVPKVFYPRPAPSEAPPVRGADRCPAGGAHTVLDGAVIAGCTACIEREVAALAGPVIGGL